MNDKDLQQELRRLRVETGSLACLGCGHEHNCGLNGCAILREAERRIAGLCLKRKVSCGYDKTGDCCGLISEEWDTPSAGYMRTIKPRDMEDQARWKEMEPKEWLEAIEGAMMEDAGMAVREIIMKRPDLFATEKPVNIQWKVEILTRRIADD